MTSIVTLQKTWVLGSHLALLPFGEIQGISNVRNTQDFFAKLTCFNILDVSFRMKLRAAIVSAFLGQTPPKIIFDKIQDVNFFVCDEIQGSDNVHCAYSHTCEASLANLLAIDLSCKTIYPLHATDIIETL